jgi:hypothetical protein
MASNPLKALTNSNHPAGKACYVLDSEERLPDDDVVSQSDRRAAGKSMILCAGLSLSLAFLKSAEAGDAEALEQILRSISNPQLATELEIVLRKAQTPTTQPAELFIRFSSLQFSRDHPVKRIRSGALNDEG